MRLLAPLLCVAFVSSVVPAEAAEPAKEPEVAAPLPEPPPSGYVRLQGSLAFGGGLRFNNPYRLRTFLGGSAESVSATSPYLELGAGFALGKPGLQHGATLRASFGLTGVPEQALSLSYLAVIELAPRWLLSGRVGPSLIVGPEVNFGGELALGAAFKATAHLGLVAEVVGNLFYGASTFDVPNPAYPILSFQLGALVDWERLP